MVAVPQRRAPGAAPRRLPRELRLPAAVPERDGERLAPAPVAASTCATGAQRLLRATRRRRAAAQATRGTRSPTSARTTSPACWRTAAAMAVFCAPTINAYGRFRPNAMAPQAVIWGRDNRGAMLRVLGRAATPATRIENRIGEPSANPYLYIAAQIHAGLDGIERGLAAPPATARRMRRRAASRCRRASARRSTRSPPTTRWCARSAPPVVDWFDARQARRARAPRPGRRQGRLAGARILQPLLRPARCMRRSPST